MTRLLEAKAAAPMDRDDAPPAPDDRWPLTMWTRISDAREADGGERAAFLKELLERYYEPIVETFRIRLAGHPDIPPEELANDFVITLCESAIVARADRNRGKFRAYLQGAIHKAVLTRLRKKFREVGGRIPFDDVALTMPGENAELDEAQDATWARGLLATALRTMHDKEQGRPLSNVQVLLKRYGVTWKGINDQEPVAMTRAELAAALALNENALDALNHRTRQKLRELLQAEVKRTTRDECFAEEWEWVSRLLARFEWVQ